MRRPPYVPVLLPESTPADAEGNKNARITLTCSPALSVSQRRASRLAVLHSEPCHPWLPLIHPHCSPNCRVRGIGVRHMRQKRVEMNPLVSRIIDAWKQPHSVGSVSTPTGNLSPPSAEDQHAVRAAMIYSPTGYRHQRLKDSKNQRTNPTHHSKRPPTAQKSARTAPHQPNRHRENTANSLRNKGRKG
jgi:hypothetical protein